MKKPLYLIVTSLLLCILTLGSFAASITEYNYTYRIMTDDTFSLGDVDDNGIVNALDAYHIKAYCSGIEDEINMDAADFDLSNSVTSRDVLCIKSCLSGIKSISDYDSEYAVDLFTIAGSAISDFEIVFNDSFVYNKDAATGTASILKTYIRRATGVEVDEVIGESNRTKPHMIRINVMAPESEEGVASGLGNEDYIYEVKDGNLYITGTLRGSIYAAYEIIEEYLGLNFIQTAETYQYQIRVSDIPDGTYVHHVTRLWFRHSGQSDSGSRIESFYLANRLNSATAFNGRRACFGFLNGTFFDNAHSFGSTYRLGSGYLKMLNSGIPEEDIKADFWTCYLGGDEKDGHTWQPCASNYGEGSEYQIMFLGLTLVFEMYKVKDFDIQYYTDINVLSQSFSICDNGNSCTCALCRAKISGNKVKMRGNMETQLKESEYSGYYTIDKGYVTFKKEYLSGTYLEMTNHAARDIQEYYPGAMIWTIIYNHDMPESIRPDEHVSVMYCGHGCMQHTLGSGECGDMTTVLGGNNNINEKSMKWWADVTHESGGQIWYWSYAVNYNYAVLSTPCILDIYKNFNYILNYCNFDGIYYEGCGTNYNFEDLKSYLASHILWNPDMTYDEFIDTMKDFLYMYYGDGYEEVYQYIIHQEEAGDAAEYCFITNHDRPWDMYSWQYLAEHYEDMRELLTTAYSKANNDRQKERLQVLIYICDFMGLSSAYDKYYLDGDKALMTVFEQRYSELYYYFRDNNISINTDDVYQLPDELDFTVCPMKQFYEIGAWRVQLIPEFAR